MPYVEGESLRTRITRQGELPIGEAVRLLRDVVDALAYAHGRGVIHRDIKPDNVLLSGRHAMVTDFGVAKAVSEATGHQALTTAGVALGTPTYMAPEQATADPHLDHRADLYAVGVVAYELLAGSPPFSGSNAQQLLGAHLTQAPRPITEHRAAIPAALGAIVMRCLEKKPADRWQSAEELLAQLEAFLTPSGGITPLETQPVRGGGRKRPIAGIVLGALLLLAAGIAGWRAVTTTGTRHGPPRIVVLPPSNLGAADEAYLADGFAEEINNRLVSLSGVEVIGRTSAERYRGTNLTPQQVGAELKADYLLALRIGAEGPRAGRRIRASAELLRARSQTQVWGKSYQADVAADYFRVQQDVAEQVANEMGLELGARDRQKMQRKPTDSEEAYDFFLRGSTILLSRYTAPQFLEAAGFLARAVEIDPRFAQAWAALGWAHTELYWTGNRSPRQLELARHAIEKAQALAPDASETQYALGTYYYHGLLDYPRALEHLRAAVRSDSGRADFHEVIGYVQRRAGQLREATASLERARRLDPGNARILRSLAETLDGLARPQDALPVIRRAIELDPEAFVQHICLVVTYVELGQPAEASAAAGRAFARPGLMQMLLQVPRDVPAVASLLPEAARERVASSFPPLAPEIGDTAMYYLSRAQVFALAGHESRASYDSAAAAFEIRIRERPTDPLGYADLGQAYLGLGRRDEAIRAGRRAVELMHGRDRWEGPTLYARLAAIYLAFGERDSAAVAFERFVVSLPETRLLARYHPMYAQLQELPRIRRLLGL